MSNLSDEDKLNLLKRLALDNRKEKEHDVISMPIDVDILEGGYLKDFLLSI